MIHQRLVFLIFLVILCNSLRSFVFFYPIAIQVFLQVPCGASATPSGCRSKVMPQGGLGLRFKEYI